MIMFLISYTLLATIHSLTTHSLIKIYLMTIELGAIHTCEECLSAHADTAGTAHTRAIHHQSIERNGGIGRQDLYGGERGFGVCFQWYAVKHYIPKGC